MRGAKRDECLSKNRRIFTYAAGWNDDAQIGTGNLDDG